MRVTPGMKRINTKAAITQTHYNFERGGGRGIYKPKVVYMGYDRLKCHYIYTRI